MSLIYEPSGMAREYSPYALNLYTQCPHGCLYCYAPSTLKKDAKDFYCVPRPRRAVQERLLSELSHFTPQKQVLLSFIGDVYGETADDNALTRWVLQVLQERNVPVAILTKAAPYRIHRDLTLMTEFGNRIQVGASLTFNNDDDSRKWEPGAALPWERVGLLESVSGCGIPTFASFEPVIDPAQSLELMERTIDFVDTYKIGKLNRHKGAEGVDWTKFLESALAILRPAGKRIYIKQSLRQAAPGVRLFGNECLPDEHCVPFGGA